MKRLVSFILIGSVVLIISGVLFLYSNGNTTAENSAEMSGKAQQAIEKEKSRYISYSPGESFITNIKGSGRYIKVKVVLELRSEKSKPYYEQNNYKIKDMIISVLRSKTEGELVADNSQEMLKASIREALQSRMDLSELIDIYIEEYVIQ